MTADDIARLLASLTYTSNRDGRTQRHLPPHVRAMLEPVIMDVYKRGFDDGKVSTGRIEDATHHT